MGYRVKDKPLIKPEDHLKRLTVRNGATMRAAFDCTYFVPKKPHDPHYHDYVGWPDPHHPGDACQMHPPRDRFPWLPYPIMRVMGDMVPIDLVAEGYNEAVVVYEGRDKLEYLETKAWIDQEETNIVRMQVNTSLPDFPDKPEDFRFTLFIRRTVQHPDSGDTEVITDSVCHGMLTVLPGAPIGD